MNGAPPCSIDLQQGGAYMIGNYDVKLGNETVGQAAVTKQGLYYHICSQCKLTGSIVCKLVVQWDDKTETLGVLVPEAGQFCLNTKMPMKRAGQGQPQFQVSPKHQRMPENFVPIRADEPFAYLSQLENAYLKMSGNTVGLIIPEASAQAPQGNDLSRECPHK